MLARWPLQPNYSTLQSFLTTNLVHYLLPKRDGYESTEYRNLIEKMGSKISIIDGSGKTLDVILPVGRA